jgi:excisionase family DNA binding protein
MGDQLLTVDDMAARLRVSKDTVYTLVEQGRIPHTRLPSTGQRGARKLIRFTAAQADQIVADGAVAAVTTTPPVKSGRILSAPVSLLTSRRTA